MHRSSVESNISSQACSPHTTLYEITLIKALLQIFYAVPVVGICQQGKSWKDIKLNLLVNHESVNTIAVPLVPNTTIKEPAKRKLAQFHSFIVQPLKCFKQHLWHIVLFAIFYKKYYPNTWHPCTSPCAWYNGIQKYNQYVDCNELISEHIGMDLSA